MRSRYLCKCYVYAHRATLLFVRVILGQFSKSGETQGFEMMNRLTRRICTLLILYCHAPLFAQNDSNFEPLRTEYGHPNFQGNWTNRLATPFQRPEDLGEKLNYSQEEANEVQL